MSYLTTLIINIQVGARCWWLITQEAEIRRIEVLSQPRQIVETLSRKYPTQNKTGLGEHKALSSNPRTTKRKNQKTSRVP
jgi:hypothetical protein